MTAESWTVAMIAVIGVAPIAIVLLVAMLRGYSVELRLRKKDHDDA